MAEPTSREGEYVVRPHPNGRYFDVCGPDSWVVVMTCATRDEADVAARASEMAYLRGYKNGGDYAIALMKSKL